MRRSVLLMLSAVAALAVVTAVVAGVLLNNAGEPRPIIGQAQPTATTQTQPTATTQPLPTCGSLNYAGGGLVSGTSAARDSATCFAEALSACHTATMRAHVMSVDTGATYNFSVSSACKATLVATYWNNGRTTTITATCQRVTASASGLDFAGCGTLRDIHLYTTQGAFPPSA